MKYLKIPENARFDDTEMTFLKTIDQGLEGFDGKFQKQLDDIFVKMETSRPGRPGANKSRERDLTRKWLKSFLKNQPLDNVQAEIKLAGFDPILNISDGDTTGAVLVPELLLAEVAHFTYEYGIARRYMRYLPFSGPGSTRKIPTEASGVSVQWIDEGAVKPLTAIEFGVVLQELKKLAAVSVITEELLEDSAVDLVAYVAQRIAAKIAEQEDITFLTGDTTAGDPFDGVMNVAGTNALYMGASLLPADITADMLLQLTYEVPTPARSGAAFIMHPGLMYYLQKLRVDVLAPNDGLGGYLVTQPLQGQPARMWGYDIILSDAMPAPDEVADGEPFLIFANLAKTCVYGDKQGVRVKLLTEATLTDDLGNTFNLAQSDAVALRIFKRVGYACTLPEGIAVLIAGAAGSGSGS